MNKKNMYTLVYHYSLLLHRCSQCIPYNIHTYPRYGVGDKQKLRSPFSVATQQKKKKKNECALNKNRLCHNKSGTNASIIWLESKVIDLIPVTNHKSYFHDLRGSTNTFILSIFNTKTLLKHFVSCLRNQSRKWLLSNFILIVNVSHSNNVQLLLHHKYVLDTSF